MHNRVFLGRAVYCFVGEMLRTSEVSFQASPHGSDRRTQRNISVRDLKAAVKYGVKEKGFSDPRTGFPRWKFTFAEVVYITDHTCRNEVTSYALPIPLQKRAVHERTEQQYREAKRRLAMDPGIITSHTVLVVDKSASMKQSDMEGHKHRYRGVYFSLAEEFTVAQLNSVSSGTLGGHKVSFTDVVTLIEMRDEPSIVFELEPISWIMYNRFVDLADTNDAKSHGNYFPSLAKALDCLEKYENEKSALSLLILSDGKPSDYCTQNRYTNDFPNNLHCLIRNYSSLWGKRLSFYTVGFGSDATQFDLLREMVSTAECAGSKAEFTHSCLDSTSLGTALSSVISSTTSMRSMLSRLHVHDKDGNRQVSTAMKEQWKETEGFDTSNSYILNGEDVKCSRKTLEYRKINGRHVPDLQQVPFQHPLATGFAFYKKYFESGAERIVYKMTEINDQGLPVGNPLVAKESKYLLVTNSDLFEQNQKNFHLTFLKSQHKSQNLARKFNERLNSLNVDNSIPRLSFLPCSVYATDDYQKTVLAEKQLNVELYKKWNNNSGHIDGIARQNSEAVINRTMGQAFAGLKTGNLDVIAESDEDNDSDSDADEDHEIGGSKGIKSVTTMALEVQVMDDDIPQAFSHFTYVITKRDKLVCDLQGVLDCSEIYPHFFLTDPCIHSRKDYKSKKYGRTNRGMKGVHDFFSTHQCNPVCQLLNIHK